MDLKNSQNTQDNPQEKVRLVFLREKRINGKTVFVVAIKIGTKKKTKQFPTENQANDWLKDFDLFVKGRPYRKGPDGLKRAKLSRIALECLDVALHEGEIVEATHYNLWSNFKKHLIDYADYHLDEIRETELRQIFNSLNHTSPKVSVFVLLNHVNAFATRRGFALINGDLVGMTRKVHRENRIVFKNKKKIKESYSCEEIKKIISFWEEFPKEHYRSKDRPSLGLFDLKKNQMQYHLAILCLNLNAGMRIGELVALEVNDIDRVKRRINISKTITINKGGLAFVGNRTKTKEPRVISYGRHCDEYIAFIDLMRKERRPNSIRFLNSLRDHKRNKFSTPEYAAPDCVNFFHPAFYKRAMTAICSKLGLPYLTMHKIRKSHGTAFAVNGYKNGKDPFTVGAMIKDRLGHSLEMSLKTYINPVYTDSEERKMLDCLFE